MRGALMLGSITASGSKIYQDWRGPGGNRARDPGALVLAHDALLGGFWCEVRLFGLGFGVRCAVFGVDFGARSVLGGLGFGSGGRGGLGWVRIWLSVYGLHCTCLLHVFMMSLC